MKEDILTTSIRRLKERKPYLFDNHTQSKVFPKELPESILLLCFEFLSQNKLAQLTIACSYLKKIVNKFGRIYFIKSLSLDSSRSLPWPISINYLKLLSVDQPALRLLKSKGDLLKKLESKYFIGSKILLDWNDLLPLEEAKIFCLWSVLVRLELIIINYKLSALHLNLTKKTLFLLNEAALDFIELGEAPVVRAVLTTDYFPLEIFLNHCKYYDYSILHKIITELDSNLVRLNSMQSLIQPSEGFESKDLIKEKIALINEIIVLFEDPIYASYSSLRKDLAKNSLVLLDNKELFKIIVNLNMIKETLLNDLSMKPSLSLILLRSDFLNKEDIYNHAMPKIFPTKIPQSILLICFEFLNQKKIMQLATVCSDLKQIVNKYGRVCFIKSLSLQSSRSLPWPTSVNYLKLLLVDEPALRMLKMTGELLNKLKSKYFIGSKILLDLNDLLPLKETKISCIWLVLIRLELMILNYKLSDLHLNLTKQTLFLLNEEILDFIELGGAPVVKAVFTTDYFPLENFLNQWLSYDCKILNKIEYYYLLITEFNSDLARFNSIQILDECFDQNFQEKSVILKEKISLINKITALLKDPIYFLYFSLKKGLSKNSLVILTNKKLFRITTNLNTFKEILLHNLSTNFPLTCNILMKDPTVFKLMTSNFLKLTNPHSFKPLTSDFPKLEQKRIETYQSPWEINHSVLRITNLPLDFEHKIFSHRVPKHIHQEDLPFYNQLGLTFNQIVNPRFNRIKAEAIAKKLLTFDQSIEMKDEKILELLYPPQLKPSNCVIA